MYTITSLFRARESEEKVEIQLIGLTCSQVTHHVKERIPMTHLGRSNLTQGKSWKALSVRQTKTFEWVVIMIIFNM